MKFIAHIPIYTNKHTFPDYSGFKLIKAEKDPIKISVYESVKIFIKSLNRGHGKCMKRQIKFLELKACFRTRNLFEVQKGNIPKNRKLILIPPIYIYKYGL